MISSKGNSTVLAQNFVVGNSESESDAAGGNSLSFIHLQALRSYIYRPDWR